ncbi:C4-dicarboxylate-binding protein DctP [Ureibacillus xyleni]|uniref:C4-dicarboxylate-binding protein DctP n=1 Tax=Ureibacillus xyleni TaxID=614648 RepID=A0A285SW70_9BACL|nr:DctP family TRAP transporter solute-binding subunit [Ureibacillus xyleni]SOC12549.1 C4-dicarboxylate-binding protein DctP [Ureibacillus xyleni]
MKIRIFGVGDDFLKQFSFITTLCFIFFLPVIILASCQSTEYPIDHEQLGKDERIVIRFSHVVGEDTPKGMAARKFAELVKERSNGLIEVQVFSNGTLYKDGEEMNALSRGDIQMIAPAISKLTEIVPEISVFDLPFAFYTLDEVHEYVQSETGKKLTDKLKNHNLLVTGLWDSGFKQISNSIRPIEHYSDLEGLRMRIMPSDILAKQFTTLNAESKRIDFNTVFNQLQKGNVDGQENTLTNITSKNLYSLQNYLTISNHGYLGYFLLFNYEFWNSLSSDVQQLLTETLQEVQQWEWQHTKKMDQEKLQDIKRCECIQLHYLSEEDKLEWEEKLEPVYDYYREHYSDRYIEALPKFQD